MELLISACLLAAPDSCRTESLVVSMEPMTPMTCMVTAQPAIAQWNEAHPKWKVVKWSCGDVRRNKPFAI